MYLYKAFCPIPWRGGEKGETDTIGHEFGHVIASISEVVSFVEADRQRRERESSSLLEVVTDEVYCDRSAQ